MRSDEFQLFEAEIKQLCAALNNRFNSAVVQSYWRALGDVPFEEFSRHCDHYIRTATRETKFPRPAELRDKKPVTERQEPDEKLTKAQRLNREMWADMQRKDPELYALEYGIASVGRCLAADHEASPQYAEALRLDRYYRDERVKLLNRRANVDTAK